MCCSSTSLSLHQIGVRPTGCVGRPGRSRRRRLIVLAHFKILSSQVSRLFGTRLDSRFSGLIGKYSGDDVDEGRRRGSAGTG